MAKRTLKEIAKDLTPKEIEAAQAVFENDTLSPGKRKSYEALAEGLGIGVRTLYEWRHNKDAFIEYKNALSIRYESEARTKVMRSVIESAEQGNASMAKLYLQTMGMLTENKAITFEETPSVIDKTELARQLAELRSKF